MTNAITILSIAVLVLVVMLVLVLIKIAMQSQEIGEIQKQVNDLQEKRITEMRQFLQAAEAVNDKLTEAASMHNEASSQVAKKIKEAIEVMNGNQYAILAKLEQIAAKTGK